MPDTTTLPCKTVEEASKTIRVALDFYSDKHKKALSSSKYPRSLQSIAGKTIELPTPDVLAYYLFWKQRARPDLYCRLSDIRKNHLHEIGDLDNLITFKNGSVHAEADVQEGDNSITGRIGEAISLGVMDHIYQTTGADWVALPERSNQLPNGLKPMDYTTRGASCGGKIIQVECKASYVPDAQDPLPQKVRNHASNIAGKKRTHTTVPEAKSGIWKADVRYGTITIFGKENDGDARCLLLDPPAEEGGDPHAARIIARLVNTCAYLQRIAPRAQLTVALVNRLAAILSAQSVDAFDNSPLLRANGKSFADSFEHVANSGNCRSDFLTRRTTVSGFPAGGTILARKKDELMFVGLREDLLKIVALQNFRDLGTYKSAPSFFEAKLHAILPAGLAKKIGIATKENQQGGYYHAIFQGHIFAASNGFTFGPVQPLEPNGIQ